MRLTRRNRVESLEKSQQNISRTIGWRKGQIDLKGYRFVHKFYIYLQDSMQARLAEVGQNRNFTENTENARKQSCISVPGKRAQISNS